MSKRLLIAIVIAVFVMGIIWIIPTDKREAEDVDNSSDISTSSCFILSQTTTSVVSSEEDQSTMLSSSDDTSSEYEPVIEPQHEIETEYESIDAEPTYDDVVVVEETYDVPQAEELEVPYLPDFKSWTNYVQCVSRSSAQWSVLTADGTYTDDNGFRRNGEDYMVAMGSYYTKTLGDRFAITTDNGNVFTVTVCDFKANEHTDSKNQYSVSNGCIVEFYVDDSLCSAVKFSGSASSVNELSGMIVKIERLN